MRACSISVSFFFIFYRIVSDRETGKQKGFAFIEYYDWQTAQSAIRNLDQHELNGRKLKINFAEKDHDSGHRPPRRDRGDRGESGHPPLVV